jgi:drug/metabolite transporter (DMT)-like permease
MEFLLLPLASALLYPLGTLITKRALEKGVSLPVSMAANNWMQILLFLPLMALDPKAIPWDLWWQAALVGLLSFLGQYFSLKAIAGGDLTVATPALGTKVLLVAAMTEAILHLAVPAAWWISAGLSCAAVFFLTAGHRVHRRSIRRTLILSLLAAFSFALGDVLIQLWAQRWGALNFISGLTAASAACSLFLIPGLRRRRAPIPRAAWGWLLTGVLILAGSSLGMVLALGMFGQATAVNIVFSSRGLWNFLLVWYGGRWLGNREREAGARVMGYRLVGAGLMFTAIVLVSV